jgi:zeta-carotene desaturase
LGVSDKIRWFEELTFIEPGGRATPLGPSLLPAPLHAAPAFARAKYLGLSDKFAIARGLMAMVGAPSHDSQESFLQWLRRKRQTERAIERFWKPVLVSALNEDLDRVSVRYAVQVFRESFLKSAGAGRMGVPSIPLSDLYSSAVDYIRSRGGQVLLRSAANAIDVADDAASVCLNAGTQKFDFAVLAVPFQTVGSFLPSTRLGDPLRQHLERFESSPITGIHLWFDREITPLPHAVLLDRTIQWMFQKSKFQENRESAGSYVELVISASKTLVQKSREDVLELAQRELVEFFPAVKQAKLVKAAVIKEIYATYSVLPGLDQYRPEAKTSWPRLFLAGDWTATDWPATMEGAVRSGYLAAEALVASAGGEQKFLVNDLPATGLMRLVR